MEVYAQRVLNQRNHCLKRIEGIEWRWNDRGVLYMFIRLTDEHWAADDKAFVLNPSRRTRVTGSRERFSLSLEKATFGWCTWPIPMC